ncbi:AzlC family ABC transporter permease [Acetanaerobacterium sp. MSJ-12]|uniref:AzlC family ABC transporter permease n=1 Tax=Bittarella massiliensis (ex Durand et al. 2017) TaxID=1720313 RepID=A0AAW5KI37_9FIRM|nr:MULTISPECIES: AzlC family ABC transporter permease [Oscillospiraceae]MBC2871656.1 AzlC family ABC transporter permease [Bittarella massiliensis (ex Durand et al. 2017)]MBU5420740.1 AzlC family ABC transporter permease [Acetanaerobacterium sp. MSJ-12]MCQ4950364.1 AzlC family ABC transporter permease [Bittarella massiliensis (ex Durand et al. 2017)]
MKKAFRAAFPVTVPVLLGYLFVGLAFGVLLRQGGYGPLWAAGMSAAVYAGSMQFVMLNFLGGGFSLVQVALMTLAVNFRHLFYGLSFTERFRQMGKKRWYMIYSLTDETYSLLCSQRAPEGVEQGQFFFAIALLDELYWIAGAVLGTVVGGLLPFDTTGIDFAMTALFIVIAVEQWQAYKSRFPALWGAGCALACLLLLGPDKFLIPALLLAVLGLLAFSRPIVKKLGEEGEQ